jgi:signal transduction histidine kinase
MTKTARHAAPEVPEDELRGFSAQLLRAQDQERRQIARELHDGLGQYLAAIKMRADGLRKQARPGSHLNEALADMIKQIETAIVETRTMSYLL